MTSFKFPIYLCEDNPKQRQWLADLIERYVMIEDYPMELACVTGDPDKLLNNWTDRRGNAVFFLDIDLQHELTGMDVARRIRQFDDSSKIIFVTTKEDYLPLSLRYKVQALDFIPKENLEEMTQRVKECLDTINDWRSLNGQSKQVFTFKQGKSQISLSYDKIRFFATLPQAHTVEVVGVNARYQFYHSMKELVDELAEPFMAISRSEIVNLDKVVSYNPMLHTLTVEGGYSLGIAQRQYGRVIRALKVRNIKPQPH